MTTTREKISTAVFDQLEALLNAATEQGTGGTIEHFKAVAYGIGAQMAVMGKPEHIPQFINVVVSELGRGLEAGLQTAHGLNAHLDIQIQSFRRDR
ncbi:hypothetical protein J2T13_004927 [Paenibacillus sp. DS2015]|uniref:hypothetical protein n=1 Tax=Paenibacillus sp. DS2015 TaxID=3373917 RepID=UPI003D22E222